MSQHHHDNRSYGNHSSGLGSNHGDNATAPGQAATGTDRSEVDSAQAHQSHHEGGTGEPDTLAKVPRSEEAKNQEATSRQSRALSGTTAPRKV